MNNTESKVEKFYFSILYLIVAVYTYNKNHESLKEINDSFDEDYNTQHTINGFITNYHNQNKQNLLELVFKLEQSMIDSLKFVTFDNFSETNLRKSILLLYIMFGFYMII